ncbi:MAG: B12-binding domain-containing radical SAM protein [Planctomycetes bacterium]|nr:B12-binding domain-containing radical SAM protein [Planctomycetota bacterium]
MPNHILLINPWIHDFSAYDLWLKPLGLLYIGSALKRHGYKISLIDCLDTHLEEKPYGCGEFPRAEIPKPVVYKNISRKYKRYGITPEEFSARLMSLEQPALICITSIMTYWYPGLFETIQNIRNVFPKTPIALGGIYATLCYEHAVKYSGADYVIKGPGEQTVLEIAAELTGKPNTTTPPTDDKLPYPAYHLYSTRLKSISMITSRGCPFKCTYCASGLLYQGFHQHKPEKVIHEIEYYTIGLGVKDIAFYDDALLINPERHIEPILNLIIARGINKKVRFHTPNGLHIKYITEPLAKKLYQAGFKTIRLGFESSQSRWQEKSSYKTTNDEFRQALSNLKKAGYSSDDIGVYVMVGMPGQTLKEINESIDFVHGCGGHVKIAQYTPIPGTKDFELAVTEYGVNPNEPLLHNKSIYPLKPQNISFKDMESIKDRVKQFTPSSI